MLHISWWFLLLGLGVYAFYFVVGLILILLSVGFDLLIKLFKLKIKPQAENLLDFFEKNNGKFIKSFFYLTILCLILIPLNNLIWHIRCSNKIEEYNYFQNKQYIESSGIKYFYKITAVPLYRSEDHVIYYVCSNKSIEEIQKDKFIRVNKHLYVEAKAILQISKEEFLEETTERILKDE